jgi:hypothetical protein
MIASRDPIAVSQAPVHTHERNISEPPGANRLTSAKGCCVRRPKGAQRLL